MKKLTALFLAFLLIVLGTVACTKVSEEPAESDATDLKNEGKITLTVCADARMKQSVAALEAALEARGWKVELVLEPIPYDGSDGGTTVQRLRTEVMSGKDPDIFLLNTYMGEAYHPSGVLFEDPTKVMAGGYLLDLTEQFENSALIHPEEYCAPVLDAGVYEGRRYILPLKCDYPSYPILNPSALKDPDFTFDTLEALLSSDEDILKGLSSNYWRYFRTYFGSFVDYENNKLLITAEDLQKAKEQFDALYAFHEPEMEMQYSNYVASLDMDELYYENYAEGARMFDKETDYRIITVPNRNGGVTACIRTYAAVNANTEYPEIAFQAVELLLAAGKNGVLIPVETLDGEIMELTFLKNFAFDEGYAGTMIVKKTDIEAAVREAYSPATAEEFMQAVNRVDAAVFGTPMNEELEKLWSEEAAPEEVIRKIQLRLDE